MSPAAPARQPLRPDCGRWPPTGLAAVASAILKTRVHLARHEFDAARPVLEAAIAGQPNDPSLRLALSRVFLREGRDGQAAEQELRGVLEVDPGNVEAKNNLALLLSRRAA